MRRDTLLRFRPWAGAVFLLDTRFERRRSVDTTMGDRDPNTRMIGDEQMQALKDWLTKDEDNRLRFVVSSVPFVAEVLRESGDGRAATDRSDDKWSGAPFRRQREEIIELIDAKRIEHVVFLVGDMHCAYHASMTIGQGRRWERLRIHELAGGPINQLQQGRRRQFVTAASHTTRQGKVPYDIRLHQFHSGANAVMHIEVDSVEDAHLGKNVPEVRWRVIRTLTNFDAGPLFNEERSECGRVEEEAPISGRIVTRPAERGAAS
ncbi:MAG: hypothetical protein HC871_05045 [Rhizobiales bacterium]|nr:hypothetical protein [Hyphomicrobiales bacterium]